VYQTRSFRAPTLGVDLKRVEVLRGPQGTLFGRNATGGAINVVLEDPSEEYTSKVRLGAGSYGAAKMEGVASGPIIKHTLLGRVSAAFDRNGGYVKNYFTGRYFNDHTTGTGRIALRYQPREDLTADFSVILNKMV